MPGDFATCLRGQSRGTLCRGGLLVVALLFASRAAADDPPPGRPPAAAVRHERRERPDLLDAESPAGLRVVQITTDPQLPSWHVYPEAPVFTPDSRRFVFVRQAGSGPISFTGRGRQYWLCDLGDRFGLRPLTDEPGAIRGTAVSPDGRWFYYVVADPEITGDALLLRRVSLESFDRETVLVVHDRIPGTRHRPSQVYMLSTISADGKRLATGCFLGDGATENAPFGLLVFTLDEPAVRVVPLGPDFNNLHPQYCRAPEPRFAHDLLIQHNHGAVVDVRGTTLSLGGAGGADLHVVRDDGSDWRDVPIGRDGAETIQGHQAWRGRRPSILSAMNRAGGGKSIREAFPVASTPETAHRGGRIPGGRSSTVVCAGGPTAPWHFGVDDSGGRLVIDTKEIEPTTRRFKSALWLGTLSDSEPPRLDARYLLETRASGRDQPSHPHPFFSPDATMVFFNSDVDGQPQIWMLTGFEFSP